jgi:L-asparaginase II
MTKQISGTRFNTNSFAPIAVATRNGTDESLYHGAGVVLGSNGSTTASIGDPELAIHPRSSLKPFQASAMVRLGLELPHRLLAVVAASHSGEQQHLGPTASTQSTRRSRRESTRRSSNRTARGSTLECWRHAG